MKTLFVFCALASAAACAQAAGLFDNATPVSTVSDTEPVPATLAKPAAPKAPSGVVQGSVQFSMAGKAVTPGDLPVQYKTVKLADGRVVQVALRPNLKPESSAQPTVAPVPANAQPMEPADSAAQTAAVEATPPVAPAEPPPAPPPAPAASAAKAVPSTPAAPAGPGYAVFVMPDGRVVRVEAPGKSAGVAQPSTSGDKSLAWTLELPGEAPIQITPEMVSAGKITLPDGRVIKLSSAAELAAQAKAKEAKKGLFSQAVPVESRLAQGGENREIPVTYVTGGQTVSLSEKVDAAVGVPAQK